MAFGLKLNINSFLSLQWLICPADFKLGSTHKSVVSLSHSLSVIIQESDKEWLKMLVTGQGEICTRLLVEFQLVLCSARLNVIGSFTFCNKKEMVEYKYFINGNLNNIDIMEENCNEIRSGKCKNWRLLIRQPF